MSYDRDKRKRLEKPKFNRLKGEQAARHELAKDEHDVQPEGRKYKGVKHKNDSSSHDERQYDTRSDDATMRPSSLDDE
jgi:hypothetical protein